METPQKAILPVAGLGTRLGPICRAVPKAMMPLIDPAENRVLPAIHWLLASAARANIQHVALVASPWQEAVFRRYFEAARHDANLPPLPGEVTLVIQTRPRGFGDAVLQARPFIGDVPFAVMLGDHLYLPEPHTGPCMGQLLAAWERTGGRAMVGMQRIGEALLATVGTARGEPVAPRTYRCTDFIEKPGVESARERLVTPGLSAGEYLGHFGAYLFGPEIFECLVQQAESVDFSAGEELQLADAQRRLLTRYPDEYFLYEVAGSAWDLGTPEGYRRAMDAFAHRRPSEM